MENEMEKIAGLHGKNMFDLGELPDQNRLSPAYPSPTLNSP